MAFQRKRSFGGSSKLNLPLHKLQGDLQLPHLVLCHNQLDPVCLQFHGPRQPSRPLQNRSALLKKRPDSKHNTKPKMLVPRRPLLSDLDHSSLIIRCPLPHHYYHGLLSTILERRRKRIRVLNLSYIAWIVIPQARTTTPTSVLEGRIHQDVMDPYLTTYDLFLFFLRVESVQLLLTLVVPSFMHAILSRVCLISCFGYSSLPLHWKLGFYQKNTNIVLQPMTSNIN